MARHLDNVIGHGCRFERGYGLFTRGDPTYLPLPFPRFFTPHLLNEVGLYKHAVTSEAMTQSATVQIGSKREKKPEFLLSMPMATRLAHDSSYMPQIEAAYTKLRKLRPALRV